MNAHVQRWIKTQGQPMSLLQKTDAYQGSEVKAARKHPDYGFVLLLICLALALVVASVLFTPALVGGVPPVGPYVGP
jgi:hypothetical protein